MRSKEEALKNELSNFSPQFLAVLNETPTSAVDLLSKLNKAIASRKTAMEAARAKLNQHRQKFSVAEAQHKTARKIRSLHPSL